jgi:FixJ family two-component response regulator
MIGFDATDTARPRPRPETEKSGEIAYLLARPSLLRDSVLNELTTGGINVSCFGCASEFLNHVRCDSAACIIFDLHWSDMTASDLQRCMMQEGGPPTIFIESEALIASVEAAFERDRIMRRRRTNIAALESRHARLTRREREVFALVASGLLNKEVAAMLGISLVTVQIHRSNLMRKMGARSFADLVCMAMKLRILEPELGYSQGTGALERGSCA